MADGCRTEAIGCFWRLRTVDMQDPANELRRITLPRTSVNKGKKGGQCPPSQKPSTARQAHLCRRHGCYLYDPLGTRDARGAPEGSRRLPNYRHPYMSCKGTCPCPAARGRT